MQTLPAERLAFRPRSLSPPPPFSFSCPSPSPPPSPARLLCPCKRARPLADVDGLYSDVQRDNTKKRRLRRTVVTSRLSAPFAVPPTNIAERTPCARARAHAVALLWRTRAVPPPVIPPASPASATATATITITTTATTRATPALASASAAATAGLAAMAGRSVLRKAAILNRIHRQNLAIRAAQERQVEAARRQFRERLAAAAHSSFRRCNVVPYHRPPPGRRQQQRQQQQQQQQQQPGQASPTAAGAYAGVPGPPPSSPRACESPLHPPRCGLGLDVCF